MSVLYNKEHGGGESGGRADGELCCHSAIVNTDVHKVITAFQLQEPLFMMNPGFNPKNLWGFLV